MYSGVDRDVISDVIGGFTDDVMCKCAGGDEPAPFPGRMSYD